MLDQQKRNHKLKNPIFKHKAKHNSNAKIIFTKFLQKSWQCGGQQKVISADFEIVRKCHHLQKSLYLGYNNYVRFSQIFQQNDATMGLPAKASHQLSFEM